LRERFLFENDGVQVYGKRMNIAFLSSITLGLILVFTSGQTADASTLKFDYDHFLVGTAENPAGPTGATVFVFPQGALAAIDVRGGAAAVREQSSIEETNAWSLVDAIVLAGGSTYGLESASGVMRELLKQRGNSVDFAQIPSVPAAIVYDFGGRNNSIYPDIELGAQAFRAAKKNEVRVGAAGAGVNVSVGKFFGRAFAEAAGQGAAYYESEGLKVFVLSVVNAIGNVIDEKGQVMAGSKDPKTGKRLSIPETLLKQTAASSEEVTLGNTTISILITNAKLDRAELKRLGVMVHTGMARSIEPFHTPSDGDVLFIVSTYGTKNGSPSKAPSVTRLGTIAAALMQEAVRSSVRR
jgi:6-aminohexanoate-oligomer endohydrolase